MKRLIYKGSIISAIILSFGLISCQQEEKIFEENIQEKAVNNTVNTRSVPLTVNSTIGGFETALTTAATAQGVTKEDVTELVITGKITGDDLSILKPFEKIEKLDLSNVEIYNNWDTNNRTLEFPSNCLEKFASPATIILPTYITGIGYGAFQYSNIIEITLPDGLENIGSNAFAYCGSLATLIIPNKVKNIYDGAFRNCGLTTLTIPNSVKNLSSSIFSECENLESVTWPTDIHTIPWDTFNSCPKLKFTIPSHITSIEANAFNRCTSLTENLNIPSSVINIGDYAFYNCTSVASIELLEGLQTIGHEVFHNIGITEITIPSTVTTVGLNIVEGCPNLTTVYWKSNAEIPQLAYNNSNILIYAPKDVAYDTRNVNVITGDDTNGYTIERMALSSNTKFVCPKEFTVKKIIYRRNFNSWPQQTPGVSCGWQTISLPFTVTSFKVENEGDGKIIAPFNAEVEGAKPFWLRELTTEGFVNVKTLEANKPYIIAMPNSNEYLPEYNISGTVVFEGDNVTIPKDPAMTPSVGPSFTLCPTFDWMAKSSSIWNINRDSFNDEFDNKYYPEGSFFQATVRDTEPFEAYAINNATGRAVIPITNSNTTRSTKQVGPIPSIGDM